VLQLVSRAVHSQIISDDSWGARFLKARMGNGPKLPEDVSWRRGLWYRMIGLSSLYRKSCLHCHSCGDCIQDYLNYSGCTVGLCYKGLRNGPCGGSRVDGTCEARPDRPCRWNEVYRGTMAVGEKPDKFACTLIPPRDWRLDDTNALANRYADLDNFSHRQKLTKP